MTARSTFWQAPIRSYRATGVAMVSIVVATALILWLAPTEQTLGEGIKVVYLHVALIWTGMAALILAGGLGLAVAATHRTGLQSWMRTVGLVGLGFFAASTAVSLVAQQVNWGGIAWFEPRTVAMFRVLAVAILVQVANQWPIWTRLKGMLNALLAFYLAVSMLGAQLVLHPRNPIGTSSSRAIQFSFYGLFILGCLAAVWLVLFLQIHRTTNPQEENA